MEYRIHPKTGDRISVNRRCPFHVAQSERMKEIAAYFGK